MNTLNRIQTILVVDDDPDELASTCRILEDRYPVLTAASGDDALRKARSVKPSLIVLDVMMAGGKDGFMVFHELRNDAATKNIPVVFLSSVNQTTKLPFGAAEVGKYLGGEPAAFLEKPVSADGLLLTVAKALAGGHHRA